MARAQLGGARESTPDAASDQLEAEARRLVDDILRPLIAVDAGTIELVSVTEERMVVRLGGKYSGCPSRSYTVHGVIERAARKVLHPAIEVHLAEETGA